MEKPNLNRILDTFIKINALSLDSYFTQLHREVIIPIRNLQKNGKIRWFSFLIHPAAQLSGRVPLNDTHGYIHIRMEPETDITFDDFTQILPMHFQKPIKTSISEISGIDKSILLNEDFAYAWKILGESSEWVFQLIENHDEKSIPISQIIQFLHFITNPLLLGNKCLYIPERISF